MYRALIVIFVAFLLIIGGFYGFKKNNFHPSFKVGQKIDSLNGVYVYYNGGFDNIEGRNLTPDGYNLGLKYQCVEWCKRYLYEHLDHKMPNSYGNAKDFFDTSLKDGQINKERNLMQYKNPSFTKPEVNDLLVFDGTKLNQYGHVAIISEVSGKEIEIIQQNVGASSRARYSLKFRNDKWQIKNSQVIGWLRKNNQD